MALHDYRNSMPVFTPIYCRLLCVVLAAFYITLMKATEVVKTFVLHVSTRAYTQLNKDIYTSEQGICK